MVEEGSWIEPTELLRLVERDVRISGDESPAEAIMREPHVLIALSSPSVRPLDLPTYRIRRDRWQAGEGPRLNLIQRSIDNAEPYSVSVQLRSQCQPGRSRSHDQDVKVHGRSSCPVTGRRYPFSSPCRPMTTSFNPA
jgi:hypothetical protein